MTKLIHFPLILLLAAICCVAQSKSAAEDRAAADAGVAPLARPYTISTAPHFAVLVEFPRADSIRRIALGDSNYFLAEADKDDPHYAIVKQIRSATRKPKSPIETNMLVYMASGRVLSIMLKAGKLADTIYSVDYPLPVLQPPPPPPPAKDLPPVSVAEPPHEETPHEVARMKLADKMLEEIKETPKGNAGVAAGGLTLRFYRMERLNDLALVAFDVENTTKDVIDLEDPRFNLVTAAPEPKRKKKNRKAVAPSKIEPIELVQSEVSTRQLKPGERAACVITFRPPVHDGDQQVVLSVANRAMADQPATYRIE